MPITLVGTLDGVPFTFTPEFGLYSDNTPWVKGLPPGGMEISDVFVRQTSLQDFMASYLYIKTVDHLFADYTCLVIPFYPCARQDRVNYIGDVLDSKAFITQLVNDLEFSDVVVFDMHSPTRNPENLTNITPAEIMVGQLSVGATFNPTPGYYDTIIAPDHGAVERASQVADIFHAPVLVAEKVRDVSTGRITHYSLPESISAMDKVLVVDDICDGGATFELLADALPEDTEKHLFVTHGLFSRGTDHLLNRYDHIITTNSVYREVGQGRLNVINLFPGVEF